MSLNTTLVATAADVEAVEHWICCDFDQTFCGVDATPTMIAADGLDDCATCERIAAAVGATCPITLGRCARTAAGRS